MGKNKMIRQIYIYTNDGKPIFSRKYAEAKELDINGLLKLIMPVAQKLDEGLIEHTDITRFRISYMRLGRFLSVFLSDRTSETPRVEEAIVNFSRHLETLNLNIPLTIEETKILERICEETVGLIPVKICLVGFGGVGKTTILKLLRYEEIPLRYEPTIFGERALLVIPIGPYKAVLFTVGGQERFMPIWDILIRGSDIIIVVTDSTPENVERTKTQVLPIVKETAKYARIVAIANKQDLATALPAYRVEQILGLKTFGCVAIDPAYREPLLNLVKQVLLD